MMMSKSYEGKKIIITGVNGGIAHASAELLASLGADVVVTARDKSKLQASLSTLPGNVSGEIMDLADETSIEQLFKKIGKFDHLVTPAASAQMSPITDMDFAGARRLVDTKQWGQLYCVFYALPYLSNTGSITLFSGTVTQKPLPGGSMFAAVGAATEAAGRIWAYELAPVRVNTIVPGVIDTRIWPKLMGGESVASEQLKAIAESLPVKRIGQSSDIAKAVAFLIDNDFVDGISLVVDGGHRLI